jgi:hypothetical protein
MSETRSFGRRALAEAVAEYGPSEAKAGHTKLSISLPTELVEQVRAAANDSGLSVSAVVAASLRRTIATAEQESLNRALELDAEENLEWANAFVPITAKLWSELEW